MQTKRTCPASRGFTLVELLVVIGIIALLISILLPALSRARQSANLISCKSSLRQLGMCFRMYADQFNGVVPTPSAPNQFGSGAGWQEIMYPWFGAADPKRKADFDAGIGPDEDNQIANPWTTPGRTLFWCPDCPNRSRNWNRRMVYVNAMKWVKPYIAKRPADILFFADWAASSGFGLQDMKDTDLDARNGTFLPGSAPDASVLTRPTIWFGHMRKVGRSYNGKPIEYLMSGTGSLLMVDGHVEDRRWEDVPCTSDTVNVPPVTPRFIQPGFNVFWSRNDEGMMRHEF